MNETSASAGSEVCTSPRSLGLLPMISASLGALFWIVSQLSSRPKNRTGTVQTERSTSMVITTSNWRTKRELSERERLNQ